MICLFGIAQHGKEQRGEHARILRWDGWMDILIDIEMGFWGWVDGRSGFVVIVVKDGWQRARSWIEGETIQADSRDGIGMG